MKKLIFLGFILFSVQLSAQTLVKGSVVNGKTGEGIPFANVYVQNTSTGTVTNFDGTFEFSTKSKGQQEVVVQSVGYIARSLDANLNGGELDLGSIGMSSNSIGLDEVNIIASSSTGRNTPVAVSKISAERIEKTLGNKELPEILNTTPSVYATKSGGGSGDARINIRGFAQDNVAVLINGIPVNDMENGWVYWSNWAGLGDAISNIEVQRGLGASKLAINSVGGTMNIITKTTDAQKGGSFRQSVTNYGNTKSTLSLSTGLMDNGLAITMVGSRTQGPGYIDATWVDAWSYFLSAAKDFGDHRMVFTAIGAPQKHGQRDRFMSAEEKEKFGIKYNKDWGWRDGEQLNQRVNFYHKPQFALNDYWQMNDKTLLSTSFYISTGNGGGSGPLGDFAPTDALGQIDWDVAVQSNANNTDTLFHEAKNDGTVSPNDFVVIDANDILDGYSIGDTVVGGYSNTILRNSMNNHFWTGILSTMQKEVKEGMKLIVGLDARFYKGEHYREVRDLMGGDFFFEAFKYGTDGINPNYNQFAQVGDRIAYDNDGIVRYGGLFAQVEHTTERLSTFLAATVSQTGFTRVDRYNYYVNEETSVSGEDITYGTNSQSVSGLGYNFKAGANYNLNEFHNVFVNGGFYTRVPFFRFAYINFSNALSNEELINEKVAAVELGYGYKSKKVSINANYYYTKWMDKSLLSRRITREDGSQYNAFITGLDALHSGLEIEFKTKPFKNFELGGMVSLGNWEWANDVDALIQDDQSQGDPEQVNIYSKGIKVGNAPQKQIGILTSYRISKDLEIGATYVHNMDLYADFDIEDRDDEALIGFQPYKLNDFGYLDLNLGWSFKVSGLDCYANAVCQNALDQIALYEAQESLSFDQQDNPISATEDDGNIQGFWGWGRTWNFALKVNF